MLTLRLHHPESEMVYSTRDNLKQWRFPCGEAGVKISEMALKEISEGYFPVILLDFESNDDLFALAQLVDALRQEAVEAIGLQMSYVPYGRQDRRCFPGEGHGLKVFAYFINSLNFSAVSVDDAHSYVTEALFNNLTVTEQHECAANLPKFDVLIAPDAGAEKKIFKHKQVAEGTEVVCASKVRNDQGKIVEVKLPLDSHALFGEHVCIVDDLCDGGATFLELGKVVKGYCPASMSLYVTHGMFTNPAKFVELNDLFDRIYVYNMPAAVKAKYGSHVEQI